MSQLTQRVGLHPGSSIDCVTEETISWHLEPHHSCTTWSSVNTHPELETVMRTVTDLECLDGLHHLERHPRYLHWMAVIVADWKTCIKENLNLIYCREEMH